MNIKKLLIGVLLTCNVGWIPIHAHTASYTLTVPKADSVKIDNVIKDESDAFVRVSVDGYTSLSIEGEPMIPVKRMIIKVPTLAVDFKVSLESYKKENCISLPHPIVPSRSIPTNEKSISDYPCLLSGKGYRENFEAPVVKFADELFVNGSEHYIMIDAYPFVYNHRGNTLDIYGDLNITISYEIIKDLNMHPAGKILSKESPRLMDMSIFNILEINSSGIVVPSKHNGQSNTEAARSGMSAPISNYVILVPENLKNACADLVAWKNMKGYNVYVKTFEEIYAGGITDEKPFPQGFDNASCVREWMQTFYSHYGTFYCLIIGDYHTSAPIRKFRDSSCTHSVTNPNDDGLIPSDAYFADLITPWNHNKGESGIYEIDANTASFSPDIPVGRLICNKESDIYNYFKKLLIYESFPGMGNADYLNRGVFMEHPDNDSNAETIGSIFNSLDNIDVFKFKGNENDDFSSLTPEPSEVINKMSEAGVYSFQTHGGPLGFRLSQCTIDYGKHILPLTGYRSIKYYADHIENVGLDYLNNVTKPSLLYTMACDVAYWDAFFSQDEGDIKKEPLYNMASAFTVAGNYGGIAFLGNSRSGFWEQSNTLEKWFASLIPSDEGIGVIENNSKTTYKSKREKFRNSLIFRHNLIGDPDIRMWTGKPAICNLTEIRSDSYLTLRGSNLGHGYMGVYCKGKNLQLKYNASNGKVSVPSSNFIGSDGNYIGVLYLREQGFLPYIQLVTNESQLNNYKDCFILRDLNVGRGEGHSFAPILNMGANCEINIKCLSDIKSIDGISIGGSSSLSLETDRTISLTGDKIDAGGKISLKANNVELGPGFEIQPGGELIININN